MKEGKFLLLFIHTVIARIRRQAETWQSLLDRLLRFQLAMTILIVLCSVLFFVSPVFAAIRYPVKELGFCRDAKECALFCEIPGNTPACWSFSKYGPAANILGITAVMDSTSAAKLGITFPVAELGGCATPAECRDFCRADVNRTTCTDFAVKYNLQKTRAREIGRDIILKAQTELGCDSATSCHNFCRKTENQEACSSFGVKYDLVKKTASPSGALKPEIRAKAQNELGCSNELSCKNLCNIPENLNKCRAFAARYGLGKLSGAQKSGLAGEMIKSGLCANEVECAAYCQKNPTSCPGFSTSASGSANKKAFLGPGGCRTEKECYLYCKDHPDACPNFPKNFPQGFGGIPKSTPPVKPPLSPRPTVSKLPEATHSPEIETEPTTEAL